MSLAPAFISVEEALFLHTQQIRRYGGAAGVRDPGALDSAVTGVQQTFGGEYVYSGITEMATAYLFRICQNHPFVDGNKRTALAVCHAFLLMNGYELEMTEHEAEEVVLSVAKGELGRVELLSVLGSRIKQPGANEGRPEA